MNPDPDVPIAWVTGAGGLIGNAVAATCPANAPWRVRALTRPDLDLSDGAAVGALFRRERPQVVIHCAARSRSPACQADPAGAFRDNVDTTLRLADLAAGRPFVFLSTDLVFDGRRGGYREEDPVGPLSVYAETKVRAEEALRGRGGVLVIRTSLNHGTSPTGDRAFNEDAAAAWRAGRELRLFTDEFRNPIGAVETARVVWDLLLGGATGWWHVAGSERLSRWEIGCLLAARHRGGPAPIVPASLAEYTGAPRAPDTTLDCARVEGWLGRRLPRYSEWLAANP